MPTLPIVVKLALCEAAPVQWGKSPERVITPLQTQPGTRMQNVEGVLCCMHVCLSHIRAVSMVTSYLGAKPV